ncbi:transposase, partial [Candidatus Bathyarchaeota archaeon]|nr:transposase [Candidatus Bathyarchaeota archaeon]
SIELSLGIELPVACTIITGNAEEGGHYIPNKNQIIRYHGNLSKIDRADAKYDEFSNNAFSVSNNSILIIEYNPHSENLSVPALKERGYDQKGWPNAPCGPNPAK